VTRPDFLLFDWDEGGHHPIYLKAVAGALADAADVTVAASTATVRDLGGAVQDRIDLGPPRPAIAPNQQFSPNSRDVPRAELERLTQVVQDHRPRYVIHLFADSLLRRLWRAPRLDAPLSIVVFRARAHYPTMYATHLSGRERASATAHEAVLRLWRRRRDAHAVFALDEGAVTRWNQSSGAAAYWFPEPPVTARPPEVPWQNRAGGIVYGSLTARKGLSALSAALSPGEVDFHVMLAGPVAGGTESYVESQITAMRAAGVSVTASLRGHSEAEGLAALAHARCTILTYEGHWGMSRVLLESALAGTPVVAWRSGYLGELVVRHRLGAVVEPGDLPGLRAALLRFARRNEQPREEASALRAFAARYAPSAFLQAINAPFA
jgi:glycosyltransferase involved in cell wall biosynthesis